jgi:cbb3-type cytochrome oxidase subunit 1
MKTVRFRPPLFLLAGLLWLSLSALLGLMQFLGMVTGVSLPPALRLVHVHGALLAGVAQIILGAMLAFIPPLLLTGRDRSDSHPVLFVLINAGGLAVLAGFALRNSTVVGVSGLLAAVAFLSLFINALQQTRNSLVSPPLNLWFYGVAILMLLIGMGLGAAMALHWLPDRLLGQIRLAHIHLNLLGVRHAHDHRHHA